MSKVRIFSSSIPKGMRIFEQDVEVAGVKRHYYYAKKFVSGSKRSIYLQRGSDRNCDPNAIRVIGKSKGRFFEVKRCIGYVPANVAKKLVIAGLEDKVKARLQLIDTPGKDSTYIRFVLLGSIDDYEKYCSWEN